MFTSAKKNSTACTPVVIFTGSPDAFTDKNDRLNQQDLVNGVRDIKEASMLPQEGTLAKLLTSTKRISGKALDEMMAATDLAYKNTIGGNK